MKKKVLLGLLIVLIVFSFATMMLFAMGFCNNIKEVYSLDKSDLIYSLLIKQILLYGVFCFINLLSTIISIIKVFCAVMQAVNGFIFGTNNVQTEINLLLTKSSEAKACLEWCKANPKECI